ncbi:MAG: tRNA (N6-isopentenyl adenosine(37)-C2)-methylthiotransferase MiaB [Deltaproteobacteria bacterium]|nr:tRNA (N6-isopentenyl adenosine(37)-C2)-methylthiotransferase MiaB [Deltaproteobacteria bacterium]
MSRSFHVLTFGCQMNVCDSSWISASLRSRGWEETVEEEADVVVLNTCSVRDKPEQKVYSVLGRIGPRLQSIPDGFAVVGGCVAQQVGRAIWKRFPFVRLVFGTDGVHRVPQTMDRLVRGEIGRAALLDFEDAYPERHGGLPDQIPGQAFVNIMQGCDNFCAYCIVPFTRGRQKSRDIDSVLRECSTLVQRGARELTLLGQNVNSFGLDRPSSPSFAELLTAVADIPGLERLRFTTSHPKDIAPEVIEAFGSLPVLCPQLHLPVQSGSNRILKAMGRKYTRERYVDIVRALRGVRPDLALSTDIIVGFPGESEQDFQETMSLLDEVDYAGSFSFMYSDRPGTQAAAMPLKIDRSEKLDRLTRLQRRQDELTASHLAGMVGNETTVLVERPNQKQFGSQIRWQGRDPGGRIVHFDHVIPDLAGRMVAVKVTGSGGHSLSGETQGAPW